METAVTQVNVTPKHFENNSPQFFKFQFGDENNGYDIYQDYDNFTLFTDSGGPRSDIFNVTKIMHTKFGNIFTPLPPEYREISNAAWIWIITYAIVFVLASVGNLLEFIAVWRRIRLRCTPMNVLLLNLCVADILVVVFVVAVEIGWRVSIAWLGGRILCKFLQWFRAFSLYLSSFVVICLTLDRFYAVLFPLKVVNASKRVKTLLIMAWIFAAFLAVPQCIVFDLKNHPEYPEFTQCTTEGDFLEEANTILSIVFMYFLPIGVILFSYVNIIYRLKGENDDSAATNNSTGRLSLRRSDKTLMDRAKTRALKLTFTITFAFIFCWSPYIVMSSWHVVDRESAEKVHPNVQEGLFLMVVANSCANPIVYGVFHSGDRKGGQRGRRDNSGNGPTPSTAFTMTTTTRKSTQRSTGRRLEVAQTPHQLGSPLIQIQSVCILENSGSFGSRRSCGISNLELTKTRCPVTTAISNVGSTGFASQIQNMETII